jgi:hypothetical protein
MLDPIHLTVDALTDMCALSLSTVKHIARLLSTFCYYAPLFHARNVHRRVEHLLLGLSF